MNAEKEKHKKVTDKMKEDFDKEVQEMMDNTYKLRKQHEKDLENCRDKFINDKIELKNQISKMK